jgi:hypothetical protein
MKAGAEPLSHRGAHSRLQESQIRVAEIVLQSEDRRSWIKPLALIPQAKEVRIELPVQVLQNLDGPSG